MKNIYSNATNARTNGRNPTEPEDLMNARNVKARIFTEHHKTEDTREDIEEEEDAGDMDRTKLAIPCSGQASLQAQVSPHFGHCDSYAVVTIEDEEVKAVEAISNSEHSDCSEPVRALLANNVSLMLVGGMGMRPYMAFKELGIEVRCGITGTVAEAVESYLKGETFPMTQDTMCKCHERE